MSEDSMAAESPLPEQRFAQPVSGPAYTGQARVVTLTLVLLLLAYSFKVLMQRPDVAWPILALIAAAGLVLLVSTFYIVTGKTTIDARGIRQQWLFEKNYSWHEISRARLVAMPLVPRLVVMTARGPFKSVHGGSPALLAAFREIDAYYRR